MTDTKLKNIGPDIGQLSTKLSFIEKVQIESGQNTGGSIGTRPGQINGNVSPVLGSITNKQKSAMELASNLAGKLEAAGTVRKNSRQLITQVVNKAVNDRLPIYRRNKIGEDLANPSGRLPSLRKQSVDEIMRKNKGDVSGLILESLGIYDLSYEGLMFPGDLDQEAVSYVSLVFKKYNRFDPFTPGDVSGSTTISLPLPENLNFTNNIKIQESETGFLGELAKTSIGQTALSNISQGNVEAGLKSLGNLTDLSRNDVLAGLREGALRASFAALNSAEPIVGGLAEQVKGGIPNPHPTVFFKGLDLRQFQWNWKLVPKNAEDARMVAIIIRVIKSLCIPQRKGSFLDYPYMILPVINNDPNFIYGNFKKSMVSQININYSGEGTSAFFADGNPVSINLGLTFQEVENYLGSDT